MATSAALIHEAIKPVADVECLDSLMGADVLLLPAGFPPGRRVFPCHCGWRYSGDQQYPRVCPRSRTRA